ncbi:hypothetical protein R3P38DRAFT_3615691 [Favolaschia claudopus]|uniref:Uncharacterized protein n=1 Tax=Favolaschia claudopus TaxID=2862362 RepID=A0AAW0A466_9AGAR
MMVTRFSVSPVVQVSRYPNRIRVCRRGSMRRESIAAGAGELHLKICLKGPVKIAEQAQPSAGKINTGDDFKIHGRILADEYGWDAMEARKIWAFGPYTVYARSQLGQCRHGVVPHTCIGGEAQCGAASCQQKCTWVTGLRPEELQKPRLEDLASKTYIFSTAALRREPLFPPPHYSISAWSLILLPLLPPSSHDHQEELYHPVQAVYVPTDDLTDPSLATIRRRAPRERHHPLIFEGGLSRFTRSLKALRALRLITLIDRMRTTFERLVTVILSALRIMVIMDDATAR